VGLLDADIYGPSQPLMMGLSGAKRQPDGKHMTPLAGAWRGSDVDRLHDRPRATMAWRGPMVTQALTNCFGDTTWGESGLSGRRHPPGTGDIQLTLAQRVPVSARDRDHTAGYRLLDARKGLKMFEKVEVRVLGVVENMSMQCAPNAAMSSMSSGGGGGRMAAQYGVQLLGELPLDIRIRGMPTAAPDRGGRARQ